jgi:hypothetical protein
LAHFFGAASTGPTRGPAGPGEISGAVAENPGKIFGSKPKPKIPEKFSERFRKFPEKFSERFPKIPEKFS